jgi:transcriptional regulator GlxA family with amidase domain
MAAHPTVRIGVFIPYGSQLLDLATVDVLATMSHGYLSALRMLPESVYAAAPHVDIAYVSTVPAGQPVPGMTAGARLLATHHLSDAEVAPGKLDIVLVPGPDPFVEVGDDVKEWLRGQAACESTDVLSVCTGIFLCGEAGILKGKKASGPRGLQDLIRKKFPEIELVGHDVRWIQDGRVWSSGALPDFDDAMLLL